MKKPGAKEIFAIYWRHALAYPVRTVLLLLAIPTAIFLHSFLPPFIASGVLNRVGSGDFTPGDLWGSFGTDLLFYLGAVFAGGLVAWRIVVYLVWTLEMRVERDIHIRVFNHLMSMSAHFHANRFGGALVSQAGKFASAYIRLADTFIFNIGGLVSAFVFTVIILWPRAPLYVAILVVTSVVYMLVAVFVTRKVRELNAAEAEASNTQTGLLADAVTNVMAVKSFAAGKKESQNFTEAAQNTMSATKAAAYATMKREALFSGISSSIEFAALAVAAASVVVFGADVATVFLILSYTGNLMGRVWDFSNSALRNFNRALGDAEAMTKILNTPPGVKDPANPKHFAVHKGVVSFNNVRFAHADAKRGDRLFESLNLHIADGEKIGLVGQSGSGKTTLTKILLRFSDLKSGSITIDGQDIAKVTQDNLRQAIAYVPQEPLLFHRSIRENIAYGRPDASQEQIEAAASHAHAAEFIETLPERYETLVGERGVKLSGGQRQRIAIARALLKDAPILVLDEATSALDSESERLIQDALWKLMQGRTAIVIAHRLSTIQRMDRIIVLDNGEIAEQGTHNQLLAANGIYARLWAHQSGGFIEE